MQHRERTAADRTTPTTRGAVPTTDGLAALRRRRSVKWTTHADDVLPMFVAETDFALAPGIRDVLREAVERGDTGYANPDDPAVRTAFAGYAGTAWGWEPDPARMRTTTDVSVVVVESLRRLAGPGDGVVVTPPVYPPFWDLVDEAGCRVVEVPLLDDDARWSLDLAGVDAALSAGARGVLLCNPHNPLGLVHDRDELLELSRVVERRGGFVVSDEIHAPLVHRGQRFTPYLDVSPAARAHGLAAESGSKAFNLAGLKCALFATASEPMAAVVAGLPAEISYRTGLLGALATEQGFARERAWLAATTAAVEENLALLEERLAAELPQVRLRRPAASYLAWLDLRDLGWGEDPASRALDDGRVALSSGPSFGAGGAGHARMNVGCAPDVVVEAVHRLAVTARDGPR